MFVLNTFKSWGVILYLRWLYSVYCNWILRYLLLLLKRFILNILIEQSLTQLWKVKWLFYPSYNQFNHSSKISHPIENILKPRKMFVLNLIWKHLGATIGEKVNKPAYGDGDNRSFRNRSFHNSDDKSAFSLPKQQISQNITVLHTLNAWLKNKLW